MSTIVITGASGGIGAAIAESLAEPGRRLVLHGRRRESLREVAERVRRRGAEAVEAVADLVFPGDVRRVVDAVGEAPVFAVVNNAGTALVKPLEKIELGEWTESLALNVTAPFLLVQGLLPRLGPGSVIVSVLSVAAKRGFAGWAAYSTAKTALSGFSRSLREELRPRMVRVVDVFPAATDTALWDCVAGDWSRERMLRPSDVADAVAYALAVPARVQVEEIDLGDVSGNL